ncbi:MAG: M14 family zinc carboxypeptidase [Candidatus Hodarchaeota archaeon]
MKKNYTRIIPIVLILLLSFIVTALALHPGGPKEDPDKEPNLEAIMTFEEVEKELLALEKRSEGQIQVDIAGYTLENRPLYIAKIGQGPKKMWIQGRIHGDEPYGNDTCLEFLKTLLSSDKVLLDEMTFWIIPCYNPDGSELFWRGNALGVDLNRDWCRIYRWMFWVEWEDPTLNQRDFPILPAEVGYFQPESQAFRLAWEEFHPDYMIDIHHQGTPVVEGTDEMSTLSFGISVAEHSLKGLSGIDGTPLPGAPDLSHIWDTCRQMAVVGYDAVSPLGFCTPTMYWFKGIDIWEGVTSSQMLGLPGIYAEADWNGNEDQITWIPEHNTAAIFFESRGGIGNKSRGYLITQNVVALHAIADAIASGELGNVDPDRWWELPWASYDYGNWGYREQ